MADKKNLPNPFPGLRPFQSDEEHLFFGRESQTLELLQLLRDNRFVGVIGTSGSGKSSLVRCGLLSELYGGSFLEAGTDWEVAVMNPGGGPFSQLSKSLVDADIYDSEEADIHLKLNATLRRSRLGLVEAIRQAKLPKGTNFLLVVDQFEEIFRYSEAGEEEGEAADDFISMILEAAKQSNIPIYVIITMRSDYIGDCSKFEGLPEEINEGEYLIPRLSREEYKSVIEGPVRVGGAKLAPRLLQRLLNDIGTESDQLPCLQHALMRTWDAWADREDAEELDLEDYRAIGGMSQALSIHADEIFDTFDDKATHETATRMFRAITEKGDDNRGIRRPLRLQQLADITNHSIEEVKTVVDPYRQQGVTFLMPPSDRELEADTVIDISHESLMRVWQRLRNWVEEEAQSARIYRRLVDTSSLWKKREAGLYHDPDLQIAQSWRDKYQPNEDWANLYGGGFEVATEFLEASEEEGRKAEREKELARQKELEQAQELAEARERSARNMKRFAAVVCAVAIIALGAMIFAVKAQKKAVVAQKGAVEAKENLRINFARSDDSLGHSFAEQKNTAQATAYFARSLVAEPNNPTAIDTVFNLLAYTTPPGHLAKNLDFDGAYFLTSASTKDGKIVITGAHTWINDSSTDKNARIWDSSKEGYVEIFNGDGNGVWYNSIDISPDEKHFVIGWGNREFTEIIDIETREIVQTIPIKGVLCRYSKDGSKMLINQGWKKATNIWDLSSNSSIFEIDTKDFYPEWNHDESKIVFGAHSEQQSAVLDIKSGELTTFDYAHRITTGASFNYNGSRILTHSHLEGNFFIWDLESKDLVATLNYSEKISENFQGILGARSTDDGWQHPSAIGSFTPDGSRVITATPNLTVQLWDSDSGSLLQTKTITETVLEFNKILFSEDGLRILIPLRDGKCYVGTLPNDYSSIPNFGPSVPITKGYAYLANSGHIRPLHIAQRGITSSSLLKSKNEVLIGTDEGLVKIFDTLSGDQIGKSIYHPGKIISVAENNEGRKIATSSDTGSVKVWDRDNPSEPLLTIGSLSPDNPIKKQNIHFGPQSKTIWIHSSEPGKGTEVWDLSTNTKIYQFKSSWNGPVSTVGINRTTCATVEGKSVRIFSIDEKSNISTSALTAQSNVVALDLSQDNKSIAVATEDKKLSIWPIRKSTEWEHSFEFDSAVTTLEYINNTNLLVAGCSSGRIHIIDHVTGKLTDHLTIQGKGPCIDLESNHLGHVAAIFQTASNNYSTVYDIHTGRPLTGEASNGTVISKVSFTDSGSQIICLPISEEILNEAHERHSNVASIWPVSISGGNSANENTSKIFTVLGGKQLNSDGIPVDDNSISKLKSSIAKLESPSKANQFFKWVIKFPGTRSDSPFREACSSEYLENLIKQDNLTLLHEGLRLSSDNPLSIARIAIYDLIENGEGNQRVKSSTFSRLENARKLAPDNPEIIYYSAIAAEYIGNKEQSLNLYDVASKLTTISNQEILRIIECQKRLDVSDAQRLILLNNAIEKNESDLLTKNLVIERFNFAVAKGIHSLAKTDWNVIKEWESPPEDIGLESLIKKYIQIVENEATKLADNNSHDQAIELLKPTALVSLCNDDDTLSSSIANLIEWENLETPPVSIVSPKATWKYLDDGTDQGTDWINSEFDDSEWKEGPGKFGYGGDGETTRLDYGGNRSDKIRTYYFRHTFSVDDASKTPFLVADLIRDDGVIVYLNGEKIISNNMPSNNVDYLSFSSRTAWENKNNGLDLYELFVHRHTIDAEKLKLGENILAAELHQCNKGSSDLGYQFELLGSNQSPSAYIEQITSGTEGSNLLDSTFNLIPKLLRSEKKTALLGALLKLPKKEIETADLETLQLSLTIAKKLDSKQNLSALADITTKALEKSPSSNNYAKRVETLNYKLDYLKESGATEKSIKELEKVIVTPSRNPNLAQSLIDLSDHYNASLFHYSAFHGGGERQDIRFLYDKYDQKENIPFDLRGVIRLKSGPISWDNGSWESSNDHGGTKSIGKVYPDKVEGIKINSKTKKMHFLMGTVFSTDMAKGKTAAKFIMYYEDGTTNEFPIIAKEDVFDWWTPHRSPGLMEQELGPEKVGWIGEDFLQNGRGFCKPYWENPAPEKLISHVDFVSGLIDASPFLIAITIE